MNFEKLLGLKKKTASAVRLNLLRVCPPVPSFVFAVLFIPPFNILISWFLFVSLNLVAVAVPTVCIVMNFVPQLLHRVKKREFVGGCSSNG